MGGVPKKPRPKPRQLPAETDAMPCGKEPQQGPRETLASNCSAPRYFCIVLDRLGQGLLQCQEKLGARERSASIQLIPRRFTADVHFISEGQEFSACCSDDRAEHDGKLRKGGKCSPWVNWDQLANNGRPILRTIEDHLRRPAQRSAWTENN